MRIRSRLHAKIPKPDDNVSMTAGNKVLAEAVFREMGLDLFLNGLKRYQGNSVAAETIALVANSAESITEKLSSFSLTVLVGDGKQKRRVFGNFGRIMCRL